MARCLTLLECGSIQGYVFASNRLREAVGGSYLIKQSTAGLLTWVLRDQFGNQADCEGWRDGGPLRLTHVEDLRAEVLYSGGGNAAVLFADEASARQTIRRLSSQLLALAPGLTLLAAHEALESEGSPVPLGTALRSAMTRLDSVKRSARVGARHEGLAVTRACATTGLPASISYPSSDGTQQASPHKVDWLAAAAAARRHAASLAEDSLHREFASVLDAHSVFPLDLDELGGREGESYMAVIHADGNRIGQRLLGIIQASNQDDDMKAQRLRRFSRRISDAASAAFHDTLQALYTALPRLRDQGVGSVDKNSLLPMRPLIYGGDDLTVVCDGRLGLALAAHYLQAFGRQRDDEGCSLSACAGVVIADTHFPLARAYSLAEDLCDHAKRRARTEADSSWLDFHIMFSGFTSTLEEIRASTPGLFWRPWRVTDGANQLEARDWTLFHSLVDGFQRSWPRSRAKGLRDALVAGPGRTLEHLTQAHLHGFRVPSLSGIELTHGWYGNETPLFDALDAMDLYLDLEETHAPAPAY